MRASSSFSLFIVLALLITAWLPGPLVAHAQTADPLVAQFQDGVSPTAGYAGTRDTSLREPSPATSFGSSTTMRADGDETRDYGKEEAAALVAWDVSSIPPGSQVSAVSITLRVTNPSLAPFRLYPLQTPWSESEASWLWAASSPARAAWELPGAKSLLDRTHLPVGEINSPATGSYTLPLNAEGIAMVQHWINDPASNFGLILAEQWNQDSLEISTSESATLTYRPKLSVTYQPHGEINAAPTAGDLTLTTPENETVQVVPAGTDPDGDALVTLLLTPPQHGALARFGPGLLYRPELHYTGPDSFTLAVSDGLLQSSPVSVSIEVLPVNDAPYPAFNADVWSGPAPLTVNFTAGGTDVEGQSLTYAWDFGDGSAAQPGQQASHLFSTSGFYQVQLTATDAGGAVGSVTRVIVVSDPGSTQAQPNVILFLGDGMGFEHLRAASEYTYGAAGRFLFEQFPYAGQLLTDSTTSPTDSAAAATAMATGIKVNNTVLSLDIPGDGGELKTVLEEARDRGQRTGLITTNPITDASPAAFGSHVVNRDWEDQIAADYLNQTRPNLLFGVAGTAMSQQAAEQAGYQVILDRAGLLSLDTETAEYVSGQFGVPSLPYEVEWPADYPQPHLSEMTAAALDILDNDPDGFFLLVEDENTDRASHMFELHKDTGEVQELERSVQVALDWAKTHPNTLILVLADHETSGLVFEQARGQGHYPDHAWTVLNHTSANAPIFAVGVGAQQVSGVMNNISLPNVIFQGTFNLRPYVKAGSNQTITLPAGASLRGSAQDDGLPQGANVSAVWSKTSGPGSVNFSAPNSVNTSASFSEPGTYVLRLTASDTVFSAWDEISVTVNPPVPVNQAPSVNAGSDDSLQLPNSYALHPTVSDDDLPNPPAALTYTWSLVSGPANLTFANAQQAETTVTFTQPGSYTLRLTVSDGELSTADELTLSVSPPPNSSPTVNAGSDVTVLLRNGLTLQPTISDDGLPNPPAALTYNWTLESGPAAVQFSNPTSASPSVGFTQVGTYTLRLTVSDGELEASDLLTVTVEKGDSLLFVPFVRK